MKFTHLSNYDVIPHSIKEKIEMLDATVWGNNLSWQDLEYMAKYFDVYKLKPNTIILKEGKKTEPFMGLILDGKVLIIKEDGKGMNKVLAKIPKGRTFGEMSLIDKLPSSASVITETNASLMILQKEKFNTLTQDNPTIANKFLFKLLRLISSRLRETSGKLIDFLEKE